MLPEKDITKLKYILYARKSSEAEDRQVASIESQVEVMREIASQLGIKVIDVMTESHSGFKIGRPVFNKMLERIAGGEADAILTWKLSRLSRNPDDAGRIMGLLQRGEIKHIRTSDRNWCPDDNVMMMYVEFGVTNQFSRDLSADTKRGLLKKAERGWCPYTTLPLGYVHSPFKKLGEEEVVPDINQFALITKGLKMVAEKRMAPREVLEYLNKKGFRTKKGKRVGMSVWYRMLTNPFYYGIFEFPTGSGKWYEGKHQKAINELEFDEIQEFLGRKDRPRPQKHNFAYSGLIKCEECGSSIIAQYRKKVQKNGNVHEYTYYGCRRKKGPCGQPYAEQAKLEEQLMAVLSTIKISKDFHEWAVDELKLEQQKEISERSHNQALTRSRYDEVTKRVDTLVEGYISGSIPEEIYKKKLDESEKEKKMLKLMLDNVDHRMDEWIQKAEEVLDFAKNARDRYENGKEPVRKEIASYLGANLFLGSEKLRIVLKKPLESISENAEELNGIMEVYKPLKETMKRAEYHALVAQNPKMGPRTPEF